MVHHRSCLNATNRSHSAEAIDCSETCQRLGRSTGQSWIDEFVLLLYEMVPEWIVALSALRSVLYDGFDSASLEHAFTTPRVLPGETRFRIRSRHSPETYFSSRL
jgi:hypothetical protein